MDRTAQLGLFWSQDDIPDTARPSSNTEHIAPGVSAAGLIESGPTRASTEVKPFLKWAGGKSRLVPVLRRCMPPSFNRYFEPFLGGGALFFALAPANGFISDSNSELIHCYKIVRDHPEELIDFLRQMNVTAAEFYRVRAIEPETLPSVPRAARFIYLNKTCFNGVYRVNKKGRFNTPFGHCEKVTLVDSDNLRRASRLISNVTLLSEDYQKFLPLVQAKDFVYLDPPYLPIGKYSDFKRYTKEFFYEHDHRSLACVCEQLHQNGSYFLLSNSFHDTIKNLYSGFHQVSVAMPRSVNCNGLGRGNVRELLISNYPLPFAQ